jgi:methionine biosynthesis protein MetW
VVSFPNFGHWGIRLQILFGGHMPRTDNLPYSWYDTPNIHFCTVDDFEALCREKKIRILDRAVVDSANNQGWVARRWPNLFGVTAVYHISR